MKRAFVCGHPVAHSRSPMIHGYWLKEHRIDGSYERIDIAPENFAAFLEKLPVSGFAGGNVTVPHKEEACRLVARRDEAAELIGAVNTLWLEDRKLHGTNTDALGFSANLDATAPNWRTGGPAVVLGAGGAARAIVFALQQAGLPEIRVVNRTLARAEALRDRFGTPVSAHGWEALPELLTGCGLLVNTTTLGMAGSGEMSVDLSPLPNHAVVTDIVYVPLETPLLAAARLRGLVTVDGLGMLLHQAVPGFEKWFGVRPQVTRALRELIVADLEAGH